MNSSALKAAKHLAAVKLIQLNVSAKIIATEVGMTLRQVHYTRKKLFGDQVQNEETGSEDSKINRKREKSVALIITDHLSVIEHAYLIDTYNFITSETDNDSAGKTSGKYRPLVAATAYKRFEARLNDIDGYKKLRELRPKHKLFDINDAWVLCRDYDLGLSTIKECDGNVSCGYCYVVHEDQKPNHTCPFCYFNTLRSLN